MNLIPNPIKLQPIPHPRKYNFKQAMIQEQIYYIPHVEVLITFSIPLNHQHTFHQQENNNKPHFALSYFAHKSREHVQTFSNKRVLVNIFMQNNDNELYICYINKNCVCNGLFEAHI